MCSAVPSILAVQAIVINNGESGRESIPINDSEAVGEFLTLAPVVQRADSFIHWIRRNPADTTYGKIST